MYHAMIELWNENKTKNGRDIIKFPDLWNLYILLYAFVYRL